MFEIHSLHAIHRQDMNYQLKTLIYMPYIDKVLFMYAMYRNSKRIVIFELTLYIPCIKIINSYMVSIEI